MATLAYSGPGFQSLGNVDDQNNVFMTNGADIFEYRSTGTLNVNVGLSDGDVFQFTELDGAGFTYERNGNIVTIKDSEGNEVANLGGLNDGETITADFGDNGTVAISRSGDEITAGGSVIGPGADPVTVDPSTGDDGDGDGTARTVNVDSTGMDDSGNDSTEDSSVDDVAFNFVPGDYTYTIDGFSSGDSLNFAPGASVTVLNTDVSDGAITLEAADGPSETTATVVLEGLTNAQESSAFNVPSFRDTFGENSLKFEGGGGTARTVNVDSTGTDDSGNDSSEDAGAEDVAFSLASGNYDYNVSNFGTGDSLDFDFGGATPQLSIDRAPDPKRESGGIPKAALM